MGTVTTLSAEGPLTVVTPAALLLGAGAPSLTLVADGREGEGVADLVVDNSRVTAPSEGAEAEATPATTGVTSGVTSACVVAIGVDVASRMAEAAGATTGVTSARVVAAAVFVVLATAEVTAVVVARMVETASRTGAVGSAGALLAGGTAGTGTLGAAGTVGGRTSAGAGAEDCGAVVATVGTDGVDPGTGAEV